MIHEKYFNQHYKVNAKERYDDYVNDNYLELSLIQYLYNKFPNKLIVVDDNLSYKEMKKYIEQILSFEYLNRYMFATWRGKDFSFHISDKDGMIEISLSINEDLEIDNELYEYAKFYCTVIEECKIINSFSFDRTIFDTDIKSLYSTLEQMMQKEIYDVNFYIENNGDVVIKTSRYETELEVINRLNKRPNKNDQTIKIIS